MHAIRTLVFLNASVLGAAAQDTAPDTAPPQASRQDRAAQPAATDSAETEIAPAASVGAGLDRAAELAAFKAFAQVVERRCITCHSGTFPGGALDLSDATAADRGGDTGTSVLTDVLAENPLWQRVTHENLAVRMPKDADALGEQELAAIRDWIEMGATWPVGAVIAEAGKSTGKQKKSDSTWFERNEWLDPFLSFSERFEQLPYRSVRLLGLVLVAIVFLYAERRRRTAVSLAGGGRSNRMLASLRGTHLILLIALFATATFAEMTYRDYSAALDKIEAYRIARERAAGVNRGRGPDDPPELNRMRHATGLTKTYYRGNCERSDQLYNQGNYRTAVFSLQLFDAAGQSVSPGQPIPQGPLSLKFAMERSNGSARELFSPQVISNIFFSPRFYGSVSVTDDPHRAMFETVEEDEAWETEIALEPLTTDSGIEGPIYFYKGSVRPEGTYGQPHYAIVLDVPFENGFIGNNADVWMDAVFVPPIVSPRLANGLSPGEWFDVRPIPEIVGENSTDPELLGLPEHLGSGAATDAVSDVTPEATTTSEAEPLSQ